MIKKVKVLNMVFYIEMLEIDGVEYDISLEKPKEVTAYHKESEKTITL